MGIRGMTNAAIMLLGVLTLQGGWPPWTEAADVYETEAESGVTGEVICISQRTGIEPERELEMELLDATYRAHNMSGYFRYSVSWSEDELDYGDRSGFCVSVTLPLAESEYIVVRDEGSGSYTPYFRPEGGMETPYEIPDSFWENVGGEESDGEDGTGEESGGAHAQDQSTPMTLRDLNRYLLERLFIELNGQNAGECRGEYRILNYTVTNRYWTDDVIGTDIVFHVVPKADRVEDLEYFQGILACVGLTDTEKTKALFAGLELPGEDDWRIVPVPGSAAEEGMEVYSSEPSPKMEALIEELAGMLTEEGYEPEEAASIAYTIMSRYYPICARWLNEEQEYSFCFRTELNEDGSPIGISIDRSGGGRWNPYTPHLKTGEEQREAYFQAGYDEMSGMMRVML